MTTATTTATTTTTTIAAATTTTTTTTATATTSTNTTTTTTTNTDITKYTDICIPNTRVGTVCLESNKPWSRTRVQKVLCQGRGLSRQQVAMSGR